MGLRIQWDCLDQAPGREAWVPAVRTLSTSKPGFCPLSSYNLHQEQEKSTVVTLWGGESVCLSSGCRFGSFFSFVLLLKVRLRACRKSRFVTAAVASLGNQF